jgi:hypothetical protein
MATRPDISEKLIHFTSGDNPEEAFGHLQQIIADQYLSGGNTKIKGCFHCVCFTEAPLTSLRHGLVNPSGYSHYSSFGVLFEKKWIFEQGGRPVIYQSEAEFDTLPESLRWRHMRYEPGVVDFTWEREWRICCERLSFTPDISVIVVPSERWADRLKDEHEAEQDFKVLQYSQVMDDMLALQYREEFGWRITVLR